MKFEKLARLFFKLESTSKRLEMIDLLSAFFRDIKDSKNYEDVDKIVYLLQGQLVSNIKQAPKIGIAEKMIIEALSIHSGIVGKKVKEILLKKGDIGVTAEIILSKKKKQKSLFDFDNNVGGKESLDISEIYQALKKIAGTEGAGSHDLKLGILRSLMQRVVKHDSFFRTETGKISICLGTSFGAVNLVNILESEACFNCKCFDGFPQGSVGKRSLLVEQGHYQFRIEKIDENRKCSYHTPGPQPEKPAGPVVKPDNETKYRCTYKYGNNPGFYMVGNECF